MLVLAWLLGIVIAIVVIAIAVVFLNRFYRKSTRDVALVRTGFGGQKVILSGGCLALPFLHKIDEINMRTMRIEVRRTGDKSLITVDRIRIDVELEFYVRVQPNVDGVATAAQALGARTLNPEGIRNLLEGRFVDALQSVAAEQTMDHLHERRGEDCDRNEDQLRSSHRASLPSTLAHNENAADHRSGRPRCVGPSRCGLSGIRVLRRAPGWFIATVTRRGDRNRN